MNLSKLIRNNSAATYFTVHCILQTRHAGSVPCRVFYDKKAARLTETGIRTGRGREFVYDRVTVQAIHRVAQKRQPIFNIKDFGAVSPPSSNQSWWLQRFGL